MTSSGGTLTHRHWRQIWDRLERANTSHTPSQPSSALTELSGIDLLTARQHAETWHRRSTVELLVRSRLLSEATKALSQPHHFERFNYTTAAYCDYCTHVLWGLLKTGQNSHYCLLSVCSSVCLSICLSPSVCLSDWCYLSVYLNVCVSVSLPSSPIDIICELWFLSGR